MDNSVEPTREANLGSSVVDKRERLAQETPPTIVYSLSEVEQKRLSLIQELLSVQKTPNYGKCQREVAKKLGITVRSVRRLLRRYQQEGISSIAAQPRRDCGRAKIDSDWQDFIVKTYREGNRGSRRMSPAQVSVRVKVRAPEFWEPKSIQAI